MKAMERKNNTLTRNVKKLKAKLKKATRTRKTSIDAQLQALKKLLPPRCFDFISTQIRVNKTKPRGVRWTDKEKSLALSLFNKSPTCYSLLSKLFHLPSVRTLQNLTALINIRSGFDEHIFTSLKARAQSVSAVERVCILAFDEMSIKEQLIYSESTDSISGIEELGDQKTQYIANHASVHAQECHQHMETTTGLFLLIWPPPQRRPSQALLSVSARSE